VKDGRNLARWRQVEPDEEQGKQIGGKKDGSVGAQAAKQQARTGSE